MNQKIIRLASIVGILLFGFIIYKIGPRQILLNIKNISVLNFLILVGLRTLYWLLRTLNWKMILSEYEKTSLMNLFVARMCGHSVSQLTPTAQLGSESTRILMAGCSSKKICLASVIVDKTIEFLVVVFFTIIGVAIIFTRIALPIKLKTFFVGGTTLALIFVLLLFLKQKKGLLCWIIDSIAKIKIRFKFLEKNRQKLKETDEYISTFYSKHGRMFVKVFLLYSLLIMLWVTEIHLCLIYIGVTELSFVDSFIITVLGNLAFIFPFIPGSLGVYEATYIGLFALLGRKADVALTLVLIRRMISLLLAGLGLLGMLKTLRK